MPITYLDQARVVQLLVRDMRAKVGPGHDYLAQNNAARLRQFMEEVESYLQRVVVETQQDIHDEFIDTVWHGIRDTRIRCGFGRGRGGASATSTAWRLSESWNRTMLPNRPHLTSPGRAGARPSCAVLSLTRTCRR